MNMGEDTIMSGKGTVRGVKNRVRAGIATFLQDQSKKVITALLVISFADFPLLLQNYSSSEQSLCVMYLTSLGIVRSTQERCNMVRKILRNMLVRSEIPRLKGFF